MPELNADSLALIAELEDEFCEADAQEVKDIEAVTNHDVKAVEYFLRSKVRRLAVGGGSTPSGLATGGGHARHSAAPARACLWRDSCVTWCACCVRVASMVQFSSSRELRDITHFLHFALTSEDVNNLAYGRMIKGARDDFLLPLGRSLIDELEGWATQVCWWCAWSPPYLRVVGA